ncbi:MAG: hypothetical protein ABI411_11490 [Tahibacter sp.]
MNYETNALTRTISVVSWLLGGYLVITMSVLMLAMLPGSSPWLLLIPAPWIALGALLCTAGWSLWKGLAWSRYLYLMIGLIALVFLVWVGADALIDLNKALQRGATGRQLFRAMTSLGTDIWCTLGIGAAIAVFLHFRRQINNPAPTLAQMTAAPARTARARGQP